MLQKQQELSDNKKEQQKRIERDWKKKEQTRVKEGKNPFYLKKGMLHATVSSLCVKSQYLKHHAYIEEGWK